MNELLIWVERPFFRWFCDRWNKSLWYFSPFVLALVTNLEMCSSGYWQLKGKEERRFLVFSLDLCLLRLNLSIEPEQYFWMGVQKHLGSANGRGKLLRFSSNDDLSSIILHTLTGKIKKNERVGKVDSSMVLCTICPGKLCFGPADFSVPLCLWDLIWCLRSANIIILFCSECFSNIVDITDDWAFAIFIII